MGNITYDYIVVGGGLSGCVVASRLSQYEKDAKILLIEAGPDARDRTDMLRMEAINLGGPLDWMYQTAPIRGISNRTLVYNSGKGLGGGTLINSGKLFPPSSDRGIPTVGLQEAKH
jgi:choline dehydrogenase